MEKFDRKQVFNSSHDRKALTRQMRLQRLITRGLRIQKFTKVQKWSGSLEERGKLYHVPVLLSTIFLLVHCYEQDPGLEESLNQAIQGQPSVLQPPPMGTAYCKGFDFDEVLQYIQSSSPTIEKTSLATPSSTFSLFVAECCFHLLY